MNEEIQIKINSLGSSGEGIGSLDGLKVFVEGALPEEDVLVRITERKKNFAKADLLSVISPSKQRQKPPCPAFGQCGGCHLMHLSYDAQLKAKRQRVQDALERIGRLKDITVLDCLPSPSPLHYRNKIQLPVLLNSSGALIGLYRKGSHEIIPINQCLIQEALGETILQKIKASLTLPHLRHILIRTSLSKQKALVIFVTSKRTPALKAYAEKLLQEIPQLTGVVENLNTRADNVILGEKFESLAGDPYLEEALLDLTFRFSASAFFQVNPLQAQQIFKTALEWAGDLREKVVVDAFCGVGVFALLAAKDAKKVHGFECVQQAITDAKENAKRLGIPSAHFTCGQAENLFPQLKHIDLAFLNPPRKGCEQKLLDTIGKGQIHELLYMSCDPATLARDLSHLTSFGYKIEKVQPFDMFPQTMHVETLVKLKLL